MAYREDNEFYDRARVNYPDHDPAKTRKATVWAGPLFINRVDPGEVKLIGQWPPANIKEAHEAVMRFADSGTEGQDAYTQEEVNEIVKQGRDRPRSLTHEQTELANKNRREARADLAAMEQWYSAECKDNDQKRFMLRRYPTGTANYGHGPRKSDDQRLQAIELGDQFWQPVVY